MTGSSVPISRSASCESRYVDSQAVLDHMTIVGEQLGALVGLSDLSLELYSDPSPELLQALDAFNPPVWFLTQMCARFSPQQVSHAVERGCGCARARESAVKSSIAQSTAACTGPAFGGGPARRQPVPPQGAEALAFTGQRTMNTRANAAWTFADVLPLGRTLADCSAPWNSQAPRDFTPCTVGRIFREPAVPLQIQTVFSSHVSR